MIPKRAQLTPLTRFCLAALPCLFAAAPSLATTDPPVLAWRLDAPASAPPELCGPATGAPLACGGWGDYVFAEGPLSISECGATAAGNESPPAFVPSGWPAPEPGPWFPCLGGECFAGGPGEEPWTAVIDWDDPHGWSVGATLLQAADGLVEARLFPLDGPPEAVRTLFAEFPVGDAHLLAQLCTIAEELETGVAEAPLVVNVSAGRLASGGDENSQEEPTLANQVLGLIEHLSADGIAFVAAAGHHKTLLFPAHLPPVLAAGPVDLQKQRHTGQTRPSWQAADELRALFPASGLELEWGEECWPVPAGASFASATAAGWIAAYLAEGGDWQPGDASAVWAPVKIAGRYHLARDRNPLPGTDLDGPSDLVSGAVDGLPCGGAPDSATAVLEVGDQIGNPIQGLPSLVELIDEIGPSPENEPCVPCDIRFQFESGGDVVLLAASRPLAPDYQVVDLYLLTGGIFHPLESEEKPSILEALAAAGLSTLELRGFSDAHVQAWHEALLVFHLDDGEHGLWTAVPIDVLP